MASIPKLDTTRFGQKVDYPLGSAFLCARFWDALHMDIEKSSTNVTISLDKEQSSPTTHGLGLIDNVCNNGEPQLIQFNQTVGADGGQKTPSTLKEGTKVRQRPRIIPIDTSMPTGMSQNFPTIIATSPSIQSSMPREPYHIETPIDNFFLRPIARPLNPGPDVLAWACLFLNNWAMSATPLPDTPMSSRYYGDNIPVDDLEARSGFVDAGSLKNLIESEQDLELVEAERASMSLCLVPTPAPSRNEVH